MQITAETIVTGAQFREFYMKHWPENFWVEEMPLTVEDEQGQFILSDDEEHPLDYFGWGHCHDDTPDGRYKKNQMVPMHELYAQAMGGKPGEILSFRCPADKVDALKRMAAELGVELI